MVTAEVQHLVNPSHAFKKPCPIGGQSPADPFLSLPAKRHVKVVPRGEASEGQVSGAQLEKWGGSAERRCCSLQAEGNLQRSKYRRAVHSGTLGNLTPPSGYRAPRQSQPGGTAPFHLVS